MRQTIQLSALLFALAATATPAHARQASRAEPAASTGTARVLQALRNATATDTVYAISFRDGSVLHGRIERAPGDSVAILTPQGRLVVAHAAITGVRRAGAEKRNADGTVEYWFPHPSPTRIVFGPTGRTLRQGEAYFADYYVAFASLTYGLTDRITIGGGTLIVPNADFWFITPKVGIVQRARVNVSAGALVLKVGEEEPSGIAYAVSTWGSTDANVTLGVGYGFVGSDVEDNPVAMLGGERRVSRRIALITENYLITGVDPLISYGVRIMGEKLSVDLAMVNLLGKDMLFPGIPFVGFVVKF